MPIAAISTPPTSERAAHLSYGECSLRVDAAPALIGWLEEFLAPAFSAAPRPVTARVQVTEDAAAYERALATRPPDAAGLDCFLNDTHVIRLPSWTAPGGARLAWQEEWSVVYAVAPDGRDIGIIAAPGSRGLRTAVMRTVRELAMNHAVRRGGLFLHAAALAHGSCGLLIGGEKGAGKSTLLLYLLRAGLGRYVANDRVLLTSASAASVRGMPTIVSLREPTLARFDLAPAIAARRFHFRRSLAEAAEEAPLRPSRDGSMSISPPQLCRLLEVEAAPGATARAMLFPRIAADVDTFALRPLAPEEAETRLRRAWLSADLAQRASDLFVLADDPPPPAAADLEPLNRKLLERVAPFECVLGAHAYRGAALAEACRGVLAG